MPLALNHPPLWPIGGGSTCTAATGARATSRGRPGRCSATTPKRGRWSRLPSAPTPRAAHARRGRRAPVRGRRRERLGLAALTRDLRLRRRRWRRGPSFPGPARNHTTGVASGGRFYVLAGRDAGNLADRRALRPAAPHVGAATPTCAPHAAASPRRACAAAVSSCSAARTWRRAGRRSAGGAVRPATTALAAARRHTHAAARPRRGSSRRPRLRDRGRSPPRLLVLEAIESLDVR